MDGRPGRPSLTERGILPRIPRSVPAPGGDVRSGGRHCWVLDPPVAPGRWPGLLVEWRRGAAGWEGLVIFTVTVAGRAVVVHDWVDARRLRAVVER